MDKDESKKQEFMGRLLCAISIGAFLLLCIFIKLLEDFSSGDYRKILVRFALIAIASSVVSFFIKIEIRNQKDLFRSLLVMAFLGSLFYPLCSQVNSIRNGISQVKQYLLRVNGRGENTSFFSIVQSIDSCQRYVTGNFTLPHWYINLESLVKVYLLRVSPNTAVALGQDGFYFEGWGARKVEKGITESFDNIADYMGQIPFSEQELKQWRRTLEERQCWLRERGSEYVFVLAPTKALVYPEFLPESLQKVLNKWGESRYQQLATYLKEKTSIPFIDLLPALQRAKNDRDYPLLFYKTDFHWNFYGAFIAYQSIINQLRDMFPQYGLISPSFSEFTMSIDKHWAHHRFIKMIGLPLFLQKREHYITMVPKPGGRWDSSKDLPEKGIYDFYPPSRTITASDGTSMNIRLIRNPEGVIPSLLLLGDSFLEKCVYFFSADAQEVMNYRTVVNFPSNIFHYKHPTLVIQEILNMFILRKPPENPPGFAESYLRQKFADNLEGRQELAVVMKNDSVWESSLPEFTSENTDDFRIARLSVEANSDMELEIVLQGGKESVSEHKLVRGKNDIYFEIPAQKTSAMTFKNSSGKDCRFIPVKLEIRVIDQ